MMIQLFFGKFFLLILPHSRRLNHSISCRLFGLKTLNKPFNKTFHAEILSVNSPAGFDALLNPFALLLCFYTLTISTKYVDGAKDPDNVEPNEFALQPKKAPRKKPIKQFALELLDFVQKHSSIMSNLMMMVIIYFLLSPPLLSLSLSSWWFPFFSLARPISKNFIKFCAFSISLG